MSQTLAFLAASLISAFALASTNISDGLPDATPEVNQYVFHELLSHLAETSIDVDGYRLNLADFLAKNLLSPKRTTFTLKNHCKVDDPTLPHYVCHLQLNTFRYHKHSTQKDTYIVPYNAGGTPGNKDVGTARYMLKISFTTKMFKN